MTVTATGGASSRALSFLLLRIALRRQFNPFDSTRTCAPLASVLLCSTCKGSTWCAPYTSIWQPHGTFKFLPRKEYTRHPIKAPGTPGDQFCLSRMADVAHVVLSELGQIEVQQHKVSSFLQLVTRSRTICRRHTRTTFAQPSSSETSHGWLYIPIQCQSSYFLSLNFVASVENDTNSDSAVVKISFVSSPQPLLLSA
jgi:hypothetical protein